MVFLQCAERTGEWGYIYIYLVVWNMNFMTFHILGIMIPTDFHIFQRGSNHQPDGSRWYIPRSILTIHTVLHSTCPLIFQPAGFILLTLWFVIINPMTLILNTQFLWSQWNVEIPYKTMVSFRGYFFRGKGLLWYYIIFPSGKLRVCYWTLP